MSTIHLLVGCELLQSNQSPGEGAILPIQDGTITPDREEIKLKGSSTLGYDFIALSKRNTTVKMRTHDYTKLMTILNNNLFNSYSNGEKFNLYIGQANSIPADNLLYNATAVTAIEMTEPLLYIESISGNINEAVEFNIAGRGFSLSSNNLAGELEIAMTHSNVVTLKNITLVSGGNTYTFEPRSFTLSPNLAFYDHFNGNIDPSFSMISGADMELTATVLVKDVLTAGLLTSAKSGTVSVNFNKFVNYGEITTTISKITLSNALVSMTNKNVKLEEVSTCDIKIIFSGISFTVGT